jgi:26S proteasome regulatory subunit N11
MAGGNFNLQRILGNIPGMGGQQAGPEPDAPIADTAEQVYISSLALLKMLKHGRMGVPMEVMGLMLGEFIDDYTVRVVDVFSMPQSGNSVSVEAVDPVFQTKMLDMLKQTQRPEMVVGWYHSHPGFGCWFSGTDMNTQQSFEQLNPRAVGVVVDPIQSVKGKVVIDCFRLIGQQMMMLGQEPRQTTSNIGHLNKPTLTGLIHGLNRHYYSIAINYRKNDLEQKVLLNLGRKKWTDGLKMTTFDTAETTNENLIKDMSNMTEKYNQAIQLEFKCTEDEFVVKQAGKVDAKKRLESDVDEIMTDNILQALGCMLANLVF